MKPLVSIIVSCYNHEKFLDDCLKSLVDQTYDNIELLICDDKSPDNSYEKILSWKERLEARFNRVVMYQNEENMGATRSCNRLMSQCRGDYVKDMASDDILVPESIERLVSFAEKSKSDIVFGNAAIISEEEHYPLKDLNEYPKFYDKVPASGRNLTKRLCVRSFICAPAVIIPRKTIEKYGFYDDSFSFEDWEYWLRVSVEGSIEYLDETVVMYRIGHNSLSHYKTDKKNVERHRRFYEEKLKILNKYIDYADDETLAGFYNKELDETIALYDKELTGQIVSTMKEHNYRLTTTNWVKVIALKLGIYKFLRTKLKNSK